MCVFFVSFPSPCACHRSLRRPLAAQECLDAASAAAAALPDSHPWATDPPTCLLAPGEYRVQQTLTLVQPVPGRRVVMAGPGAVLSGVTQMPAKTWTQWQGSVYRTPLPASVPDDVQQLFWRRNATSPVMLTEARWPNVSPGVGDYLNKSFWQKVDHGSSYGHVISDAVAATGLDLTGALATLNVAHQFCGCLACCVRVCVCVCVVGWWVAPRFTGPPCDPAVCPDTWTRAVQNHTAGSPSFMYKKNLPGLAGFASLPHWPASNMFFVSGLLSLLDVPGEWFVDRSVKPAMLYAWMPDGSAPGDAVWARTQPLLLNHTGTGITVQDMKLLAGTMTLQCSNCVVSNMTLLYPTFNRQVLERDVPHNHTLAT